MARVFGDAEVVADKGNQTLLRGIRPEFQAADHFVYPKIRAVKKRTCTGEIGDGKIFVRSIKESVRIATRQIGDAATG
jgi:nitrogen regulatory protein PII